MFIRTNRSCYNSRFAPIDTMLRPEWPPTYVACDCGKRAKHIVNCRRLSCGALHFEETRIWKCPACGQKYRLLKGSFKFERVEKSKEEM
ncbi:hypothetical protein H6231_002833 [Enterococcus hirae]|nr:hypothetical protein [Enterococcus hirae]